MPMKHKLASTFIYMITAGYFVVSLYLLIFISSDDNVSCFEILRKAWREPEYEEVFRIGIASICINLLMILIIFLFLGRTRNVDYCLAAIAWGLALVAWYYTPGLILNYVLGAVSVTILSAPHLKRLGIER